MKRINTLKIIRILTCLILLTLASCQKDFNQLNVNPNAPEKVAPQFLLSNVLYEAANQNSMQGWLAGNFLSQHTSNLEFLPIDRYDLGTNTEYWEVLYRLLNDVESMRELDASGAYEGPALVLRAYLASVLTDLWSDVPFSEALKGRSDGNFTPAYDSQEDIYTGTNGILQMLRDAISVLENTNSPIEEDILYGGDTDKWIRLANTLRVRYLLRISGQIDVSTELQALVNEDGLMRDAEDNAAIPYLASAPNQWFIFTEREGRYSDVRMSGTADSIFHVLDDPRMGILYKPTVVSVNQGAEAYRGLPNGLSRASQNAYDLSDISLLGARFRDQPDGVEAVFMLYHELQFALAEAAHKGLISGSPADFYEKAIAASFDYYQIPLPADYLSRPEVELNGTDDLNKIMTQKWVAQMLVGYESWFEFRRTGFPLLSIPQDNLNGDVFPVRYRYPETEQAANGSEYERAVSRIGGDSYNSKGWWEL